MQKERDASKSSKNYINRAKNLHFFGVVFGRILCKSMLKMWLGTGAATGVCFIGSWTAPTSKNDTRNLEKQLNHGRVIRNHSLAEKEENLEIDAPRRGNINFGSHF